MKNLINEYLIKNKKVQHGNFQWNENEVVNKFSYFTEVSDETLISIWLNVRILVCT